MLRLAIARLIKLLKGTLVLSAWRISVKRPRVVHMISLGSQSLCRRIDSDNVKEGVRQWFFGYRAVLKVKRKILRGAVGR